MAKVFMFICLKKFSAVFFAISLINLSFIGCKPNEVNQESQPEILIYCGITMIKPVKTIADFIETRQNCVIKISTGGSGDMLRSIKVNQVGDLYLPGSESYMKTAVKEGIVIESAVVGFNRAAIIVAKDNPLNIRGLDDFTRKNRTIVLGNPESGSIGRETKRILEEVNLFEKVFNNAAFISTDSKGLAKTIRERKADITINWNATVQMQDNSNYMEAIKIEKIPATPLYLGLLKFSDNTDLSRLFIAYAVSNEGQEVFRKYGFK